MLEFLDDINLNILSYLDVYSLVNLSSTCHYFYAFVLEKTIWLDALESMRLRRPIPLAYFEQTSRSASANLSVERLRGAVIRAAKIERNWSREMILPTRYVQHTPSLAEEDEIKWVCNIGASGIVLMYTVKKWCTCTFGNNSVTFQTQSGAACYDFDIDPDGITLIFNADDEESNTTMEIYRVEFHDSSHRLAKCVPTGEDVRSNFLEDELAGCVLGTANSNYEIIAVDWRTGMTARIDTGIPKQVQDNITASATKDHLLIGCEGKMLLQTWTYSLESLRRCVAAAKTPEIPYITSMRPQESREVLYLGQTALSRSFPSIVHSTSRGISLMGRQCILTKLSQWRGQQGTFTYAMIPDNEHKGIEALPEGDEVPDAQLFLSVKKDSMKKSISKKPFIYNLPPYSNISAGNGEVFLHDLGFQGKNAVWVEESTSYEEEEEDGDGEIRYLCRLATFNPYEDLDESPVSKAVSIVHWEAEGFSWGNVRYIHIDDSAGVLTFVTKKKYWMLYFD